MEYRDCNSEVIVKIIGKLTLELPELEVNMHKQLKSRYNRTFI